MYEPIKEDLFIYLFYYTRRCIDGKRRDRLGSYYSVVMWWKFRPRRDNYSRDFD